MAVPRGAVRAHDQRGRSFRAGAPVDAVEFLTAARGVRGEAVDLVGGMGAVDRGGLIREAEPCGALDDGRVARADRPLGAVGQQQCAATAQHGDHGERSGVGEGDAPRRGQDGMADD